MTQTIEHLECLVGFESVSAQSNLGIVGYIEYFLHDLGFRVTRISDGTGKKAGLFAEIGPKGRGILLSGHTDVVPVEGQNWTRDPFRLSRENGRLFGRGTTDMKGYLAAMLSAAEAASARDLKEPLKLVFSYDEEIGCVGIQNMVRDLAPLLGGPRACIVGEPTGMQVAIGHKGKSAWKAVCHGQAGHSALAPDFVNALHLAGDFMVELRRLQTWLKENGTRDSAYDIPYSTIHVGKMSGGVALNMVPEQADLYFELRHVETDPANKISGMIRDAAMKVSDRYRAVFSEAGIVLKPYNAYPGLDVTVASEAVAIGKACAGTQKVIKVAFGTEAGVFAGMGVPTIVCGPGCMEGQGHKPDEFIEMDQLSACDRMMDRILDEITC